MSQFKIIAIAVVCVLNIPTGEKGKVQAISRRNLHVTVQCGCTGQQQILKVLDGNL